MKNFFLLHRKQAKRTQIKLYIFQLCFLFFYINETNTIIHVHIEKLSEGEVRQLLIWNSFGERWRNRSSGGVNITFLWLYIRLNIFFIQMIGMEWNRYWVTDADHITSRWNLIFFSLDKNTSNYMIFPVFWFKSCFKLIWFSELWWLMIFPILNGIFWNIFTIRIFLSLTKWVSDLPGVCIFHVWLKLL